MADGVHFWMIVEIVSDETFLPSCHISVRGKFFFRSVQALFASVIPC